MKTLQTSALPGRGWRRLVVASMLGLLAAAGQAATISFENLDFQSSDQSMWGAGNAPGLEIDRFLGTQWNTSAKLGGIDGEVFTTTVSTPRVTLPSGWECHGFLCSGGHFHNPGGIEIVDSNVTIDTRKGAEVNVATSGRVGFQFGMSADSGSVDTNVLFDSQLLIPDVITQGELFSLSGTSSLTGGLLETNFPELSVSLDAIVGVRASASATACLPPLGCTSGSTGQLGFADQTIPIVSFNDADSPGQIKVLGALDPTLFQFDSEISIPGASGGSLGGVTVHVPDINTSGGVVGGTRLTSSGEDDLLRVGADLDGLALAPLGLPGGGVSFNAGILAMSADLIDIDTGPIMKIVQDFEFVPTLMVDLLFDSAVQIAGFLSPQTQWSGPLSALPSIALLTQSTLVTPTFWIDGLFRNNTLLGLDGFFQLDILKASFALEAFGLSFDLGQLGPLFQVFERGNLFNTPPIISSQFALGGFNRVQGGAFLIEATRVPEPGTLVLLAVGLLLLLVARNQRRPGDMRATA